MASNAKKAEWLKEHLHYELMMLLHTYGRVCELNQCPDRCAFYESFAVHARNLYNFLTNDEDSRNYRADEFVYGFESKGNELHGKIQRMNIQVQHMGKARVGDSDSEDKITTVDCETVARWIEKNLQRFLNQLQAPYKQTWIDLSPPMQPGQTLTLQSPKYTDSGSASSFMTCSVFPALATES